MELTSVDLLATVRDYAGIQAYMRARADALNISREMIDELAYLPAGYASKVLATNPSRRIGPNLIGDMLRALGLKLLIVEDAEALVRTISKGSKRSDASEKWAASIRLNKGRITSRRGKKLRAKQLKTQSPADRRRIATTAIRARWAKRRVLAPFDLQWSLLDLGVVPFELRPVNAAGRPYAAPTGTALAS
jgi:hypothetical protein